jgi:hypothetical protein
MMDELMKPYSAEEGKHALFSVGDLKAPGPDVLHALCFKKCWHILGDVLSEEVLVAINTKSIST